jgi:hypothetical protein
LEESGRPNKAAPHYLMRVLDKGAAGSKAEAQVEEVEKVCSQGQPTGGGRYLTETDFSMGGCAEQ